MFPITETKRSLLALRNEITNFPIDEPIIETSMTYLYSKYIALTKIFYLKM
jgi:hypothetical protein